MIDGRKLMLQSRKLIEERGELWLSLVGSSRLSVCGAELLACYLLSSQLRSEALSADISPDLVHAGS